MRFHPKLLAPVLAGALGIAVFVGYSEASGGHGAAEKKDQHGGKAHTKGSSGHHKKGEETNEHAHQGSDQKGAGGHSGGHRHGSWSPPPPNYAQLSWAGWEDPGAAQVGKQIYQQQCLSCHGASGQGDGPVAGSLAHPPADLTNHFHTAPGSGDGYLFWRVSEGGAVEPFRSMKSAMPPFAGMLNRAERWSVLTYVHQAFHGSFPAPANEHDSSDHPH